MTALSQLTNDPRVRVRRGGEADPSGKCVVYWMQRAQRGSDNHALDLAVHAANALRLPVVVYLAPVPFYPHANLRHYAFLQKGIADIARACEQRGVGFVLRRFPDHSLAKLLAEARPAVLVGDENPLRETEHWREVVAARCPVPFFTVDADVIVPSKLFIKKQFSAHILRTRMERQLPDFLHPYENPAAQYPWQKPRGLQSLPLDCDITEGWEIDRSVPPVSTFTSGSVAALAMMRDFIAGKLGDYSKQRNHPDVDGTSRMSPYLHYGHISPLTIALAVRASQAPQQQKDAYLDELITWRELAVNFVKYQKDYDSVASADDWAARSLAEHASDEREHRYTEPQLEAGETHDALWNAAHRQMVEQGWMHNYMRMYWAKKILEWTPSAAVAFNLAVKLNDKYELDGRDPNGYAGIAWAITGKHDRAWFDRPVFGKVRYMSGTAAARKFDVKSYIAQVSGESLF